MNKKCRFLLAAAFIALSSGGVYAQKGFISIGAGLYFNNEAGGGGVKAAYMGETTETTYPYAGGGGYVFFDGRFFEVSAGFLIGGGDYKINQSIGHSVAFDLTLMNLDFGLYGKYPFKLGEKIRLFPLFGVEYQLVLMTEIDGKTISSSSRDFSALWFKVGAGIDFIFIPRVYLRIETLGGVRLPNKADKNIRDELQADMPGASTNKRLGIGLTIKAAIGFQF